MEAHPRRLRVFELLAPPAVAAFVDELAGRVEIVARRVPGVGGGPLRDEPEQPRAMQMNVGQMEPHRPALGDLKRLVEVLAPAVEVAGHGAPQGAGEEAAGNMGLIARAVEEVNSSFQAFVGRRIAAQYRVVSRGAGEREMLDGDRENWGIRVRLHPFGGSARAIRNSAASL